MTKGSTNVLVVGRGEKGERGRVNGVGEAVETSAKFRDASRFNVSLGSYKAQAVEVLREDEFFCFLLSERARTLVHAVGRYELLPTNGFHDGFNCISHGDFHDGTVVSMLAGVGLPSLTQTQLAATDGDDSLPQYGM